MTTSESQPEKYRMTFRNSLGAWAIAIVLYYPLRLVLAAIFIVGSDAVGIEQTQRVFTDLTDLATVLAFVGVLAIGNRLAYRFWKKKHPEAA